MSAALKAIQKLIDIQTRYVDDPDSSNDDIANARAFRTVLNIAYFAVENAEKENV